MGAESEIRDRTRERLTDFLRRLPAAQARVLAESVEDARRSGETGLPYQLILDALAPVLERSETAAESAATFEDLFVRPFEDLLVEGRPAKARGRIARSSVTPVWTWLSQELSPDLMSGLPPEEGAGRSVSAFHRACARSLGEAVAREDIQDSLAARLGGPEIVEDARNMAAILEIAADALDLRERFARPLRSPGDADLNTLVLMFDDFAERHPGRAADFFILLSARMERPWEVLDVMARMAGRVHSGRPDTQDTDAVRDWLFADLEADAEFFRRLNTSGFDPAEVADALKSFTRMVNGLSRADGFATDGPWSRRMMTCRSLVAEKMEIMMERVPRDILAALPVHKIGRFGRVRRRPDTGSPPDAALADPALRMAQLADACRAHAADGAFKVAFSEAIADTREGLSEYSAALLDEMKRDDKAFTAAARAYLDLVIRLTAHAIGPEQAGRLRRDAAALGAEGLPDAAVS